MDELTDFRKNALRGVLAAPLCADYRKEWFACGDDDGELMRLALRQQSLPYLITHCNDGYGMSKEYIKERFGKWTNGHVFDGCDGVAGYTYAIYVDSEGILSPVTDITAFMWCNTMSLEIKATRCPIFYVGCNSHLSISCDGYNTVKIYLFDESSIEVYDADDTCEVIIYRYGNGADVACGEYASKGSVKVFNKELRL